MKWLWRSLAILVVLAGGFWLWQALNPSPQKIIRARLQQLAREFTFSPSESDLARLGKISRLPGYCAEEVEVQIAFRDHAEQRTFTREMILAAATGLRHEVANGLKVEFLDQQVALDGNANAVVELTMKVTTPGDNQFNVQEMKFALSKTNDQWLIYRVETVRTLK
jgi:hypothetical protein